MVNGFHHCKISPFFTILLIKFFKPRYIVFDIWKYIVKASTIKTDYLYRYSNAKNSPKHSSRYKLCYTQEATKSRYFYLRWGYKGVGLGACIGIEHNCRIILTLNSKSKTCSLADLGGIGLGSKIIGLCRECSRGC